MPVYFLTDEQYQSYATYPTLTFLIAKVRDRVSKRLWQRLTLLVNASQKVQLEDLPLVFNEKI